MNCHSQSTISAVTCRYWGDACVLVCASSDRRSNTPQGHPPYLRSVCYYPHTESLRKCSIAFDEYIFSEYFHIGHVIKVNVFCTTSTLDLSFDVNRQTRKFKGISCGSVFPKKRGMSFSRVSHSMCVNMNKINLL